MQPIAIVHVPNNLMELLYNDKNNSIFVNQRTSRKFVFKIGRLAGKIKNYFKRTQTKVISLISYWAVETVLFSIIMLSATTLTAFLAAMFLYLYGTYVIYSAIDALVK